MDLFRSSSNFMTFQMTAISNLAGQILCVEIDSFYLFAHFTLNRLFTHQASLTFSDVAKKDLARERAREDPNQTERAVGEREPAWEKEKSNQKKCETNICFGN